MTAPLVANGSITRKFSRNGGKCFDFGSEVSQNFFDSLKIFDFTTDETPAKGGELKNLVNGLKKWSGLSNKLRTAATTRLY
jgi:hypothetical protein